MNLVQLIEARAHRALRRLANYHTTSDEVDDLPTYIEMLLLRGSEKVLGVYKNSPQEQHESVVVTTLGLHIHTNGEWQIVDYAQIDLENNGITEAVRIADMVEDRGLRVINHFYTNGIGLAAGLHFLASRKSAFILEYCVEDTPIRWDITRQKMEISDGFVHVPEGPGLGIDLNEETIERYRLN